jgi:hypothetical protein
LALPNGEGINLRAHSLGVDPYVSWKSAPRVATITLSSLPECFTDAKDEWTLPIPRSGTWGGELAVPSITIDSHFRGFTPLNFVDDIDHKIEQVSIPSPECISSDWCSCIAITGLSSHPFGTWKDRGGQHMWLRDCLPQDLQGARVLLYGYDTNLLESQSFQGIYDAAITFRTNLRSIRNTRKVSAPTE